MNRSEQFEISLNQSHNRTLQHHLLATLDKTRANSA